MGDLGPGIVAARPSGSCPANLAYLDPVLPHTSDIKLERVRGDLLAADMTAARTSPPEDVMAALEASDKFRQTAEEAVATLHSVSSAPEHVLEQVRKGTYLMNDGMEGATVRALVGAWYGMIGAQEMAVTIACYVAT
jgi:hypothetical protein